MVHGASICGGRERLECPVVEWNLKVLGQPILDATFQL